MTAPAIRVERTVEWPDTDAAGHYHHSSVIRWVEAAETVAARGRLVCVQSDPDGGGGQPWADDVAAILRGETPSHGGL